VVEARWGLSLYRRNCLTGMTGRVVDIVFVRILLLL
jgi:hypothetical protein